MSTQRYSVTPHPIETIDDPLFRELQLGLDPAAPREPAKRRILATHGGTQIRKPALQVDALIPSRFGEFSYFRSIRGDFRRERFYQLLLIA